MGYIRFIIVGYSSEGSFGSRVQMNPPVGPTTSCRVMVIVTDDRGGRAMEIRKYVRRP
jgi:hypothetical protein